MNKLYKTLIYDREVSLSVLDTKELVNAAIKVHNLNDVSARMLGGLLTACAYMAGCLKSEKGGGYKRAYPRLYRRRGKRA